MSEPAATLGFIGLGVMGGPMCRNVVKKHGGPVYAFDMVPAALEELREAGAIPAQSITEVARAAKVIFLSLPGGKQVQAVCAEIADVAAPGTIIIDLSTTSVAEARAVAARQRFADAFADDGVGLEHADAGSVNNDFDRHVAGAQVGLQIARIVEREIPFAGVVVAHLHDDPVFRRRLQCPGSGRYECERCRHERCGGEVAKAVNARHESVEFDTRPVASRRTLIMRVSRAAVTP